MPITAENLLAQKNPHEDKLVTRLQAKEGNAVDDLVNTYADRLLRVATLILGDSYLAEDVVQESLLDAITNIDQFRSEASVYSWLYTILIRRCRRYQRKKSWNMLFFLSDFSTVKKDILQDSEQKEISAHEKLEEKFMQTEVRKAVAQLKPNFREVIALFYFEELSIDEIANITQKPIGTVKSNLYRARNKLKNILGEEGD